MLSLCSCFPFGDENRYRGDLFRGILAYSSTASRKCMSRDEMVTNKFMDSYHRFHLMSFRSIPAQIGSSFFFRPGTVHVGPEARWKPPT